MVRFEPPSTHGSTGSICTAQVAVSRLTLRLQSHVALFVVALVVGTLAVVAVLDEDAARALLQEGPSAVCAVL